MNNKHFNQPVIEQNLPSPANQQEGVVLLVLHGRNQVPVFMQNVLKQARLAHLPFVIPAAADKAWYNDKFMAPLEKNQPDLDMALEVVDEQYHRLIALGYSSDQVVLVGFSQGACLAAQYALNNPRRYRAIAILTGGYIGPEGIDWGFTGNFENTPVYVTTSQIDEWVPPMRVSETADVFEQLNAHVRVEIFDERPHEVSPIEMEYLRQLALD